MVHISRLYNLGFKPRQYCLPSKIDSIAENLATENKFSKNADFTKRRLE